jgi:predicted deacylase
MPVVNVDGWDHNERLWDGIDLNDAFLPEKAPPDVLAVMQRLQVLKPDVFVDLHEDSTRDFNFVYRLDDTEQMPTDLAHALGATIMEWTPSPGWDGTSEVFVRSLGTPVATTLETTPHAPIRSRVAWHKQALNWIALHGERYL